MLRKTLTELAINTLTSRPVCKLMQPLRTGCIPVFMLHRFQDDSRGVTGHSISHLEKALVYLKENGYESISVQSLVENILNGAPIPKKAVAFTMDDGFYEQATLALPLFEKHQTHVTLFLATDMLDNQYWSWDYKVEFITLETPAKNVEVILAGKPLHGEFSNEQDRRNFVRAVRKHLKTQSINTAIQAVEHLAEVLKVNVPLKSPPAYQPINWQQARELESQFIHFGAHTCAHHILTQLDGDSANAEIAQSWERTQQELKSPCSVFCYPTGREFKDFGNREKKMVSNAGMIGAFSADPGYVFSQLSKNDVFALKRFSFPDSFSHFKQYCSWLERGKETLIHN
jgi:peptidoglycan/xylan/chitin deacetylase (PgdA/CDA1 family)